MRDRRALRTGCRIRQRNPVVGNASGTLSAALKRANFARGSQFVAVRVFTLELSSVAHQPLASSPDGLNDQHGYMFGNNVFKSKKRKTTKRLSPDEFV